MNNTEGIKKKHGLFNVLFKDSIITFSVELKIFKNTKLLCYI